MDLILWRHAHAEEGSPDLARPLSDKGLQQAAQMAAWLKPLLPATARILVSPARRTQQTAQALEMEYETCAALVPGSDAGTVLATAGWPDNERPALVVGHQPTLGQVAATLLADSKVGLDIPKAGIWWFSGEPHGRGIDIVLRAVMTPRLLAQQGA